MLNIGDLPHLEQHITALIAKLESRFPPRYEEPAQGFYNIPLGGPNIALPQDAGPSQADAAWNTIETLTRSLSRGLSNRGRSDSRRRLQREIEMAPLREQGTTAVHAGASRGSINPPSRPARTGSFRRFLPRGNAATSGAVAEEFRPVLGSNLTNPWDYTEATGDVLPGGDLGQQIPPPRSQQARSAAQSSRHHVSYAHIPQALEFPNPSPHRSQQ